MYYESDNGSGCIGIFIGILFLIAIVFQIIIFILAYVVATLIIIFDYLAQPFIWVGITNPAVSWIILGCVIGAVVGLVKGLKRSGRSHDIPKVYVAAFGLLLILSVGAHFKVSSQFDTSTIQKVVLKENFSSPKKWNFTKGATIKDGGLFQLQPKVHSAGWSIWNGQNFTNLDFSSDITKVDGPNNTAFGLLARVAEDNQKFYYLLITGNSVFSMGKYTENGLNNLIDWTKSSSIKPGNNKNRLRIVCKGNLIIGFINDERVGNFVDASYPSGKIALASARSGGNGVAVYFSNVIAKENSK